MESGSAQLARGLVAMSGSSSDRDPQHTRTARRAEHYPIDHFGCYWSEHITQVAADRLEVLRRHM